MSVHLSFTYHIQYKYMYSFRARGKDNIGLNRVSTHFKNQCEKLLNTQNRKLESTMASTVFVGGM